MPDALRLEHSSVEEQLNAGFEMPRTEDGFLGEIAFLVNLTCEHLEKPCPACREGRDA
jgi:hypothetical protein